MELTSLPCKNSHDCIQMNEDFCYRFKILRNSFLPFIKSALDKSLNQAEVKIQL